MRGDEHQHRDDRQPQRHGEPRREGGPRRPQHGVEQRLGPADDRHAAGAAGRAGQAQRVPSAAEAAGRPGRRHLGPVGARDGEQAGAVQRPEDLAPVRRRQDRPELELVGRRPTSPSVREPSRRPITKCSLTPTSRVCPVAPTRSGCTRTGPRCWTEPNTTSGRSRGRGRHQVAGAPAVARHRRPRRRARDRAGVVTGHGVVVVSSAVIAAPPRAGCARAGRRGTPRRGSSCAAGCWSCAGTARAGGSARRRRSCTRSSRVPSQDRKTRPPPSARAVTRSRSSRQCSAQATSIRGSRSSSPVATRLADQGEPVGQPGRRHRRRRRSRARPPGRCRRRCGARTRSSGAGTPPASSPSGTKVAAITIISWAEVPSSHRAQVQVQGAHRLEHQVAGVLEVPLGELDAGRAAVLGVLRARRAGRRSCCWAAPVIRPSGPMCCVALLVGELEVEQRVVELGRKPACTS